MSLVAEIALVVLTAIGVAVAIALLPQPPPARLRRAPRFAPSRPEQLVSLERLVAMAGTSAAQVHAYLRPLLVEIVSARLAARGQTLDRMREDLGRRLLGERLWEIVRPGRPFPEDRHGPGVSTGELAGMLELIERL